MCVGVGWGSSWGDALDSVSAHGFRAQVDTVRISAPDTGRGPREVDGEK